MRADEKLRAADYLVDVPWRPEPFGRMADVARVAEGFTAGATLVVQGLHHWWPSLSAFCRSLEAALGHPAQANAYYTPRSAQGLPVHHDTHDVFCLQIAGEKRWLVYEPVWELPLQDQRYDESLGEPGEPVLDVTLAPGDTLYLPRGWLHEAKTSDSDSLHLTVGVNVYTWLDAFKAALDDCGDDARFRHSPDGDGRRSSSTRSLERLIQAAVRRRQRDKLVRTPPPDPRRSAPAAPRTRRARGLRPRSSGGRPRSPTCRGATARRSLLSFDGRTLEFPARACAGRARVRARRPTRRSGPSDLPGKLDADGRLVLVGRLVREGLLRITDA